MKKRLLTLVVCLICMIGFTVLTTMGVFAASANDAGNESEIALENAKSEAIDYLRSYAGHEPSKELQYIIDAACTNISKASSPAEVDRLKADAVEALDQQIAFQEKLAKFEFVKVERIAKAEDMLKENDSDACRQIVEQYIEIIRATSFDFRLDETQNRENLDAVLDDLGDALETQRSVDAAAEAEAARVLADAKTAAVSELRTLGQGGSAEVSALVSEYSAKINDAKTTEEVNSILTQGRVSINKQYESEKPAEPEPEEESFSKCPIIRLFQKVVKAIKNLFN